MTQIQAQQHQLSKQPVIVVKWQGLKRIAPPAGFENCRIVPKADLYIDCRGIREAGLKGASGHDPAFQAGVKEHSSVSLQAIEDLIIDSLRHIGTRRAGVLKPLEQPYTVMFMCAYGVHRSVSTGTIIAQRLRAKGYTVQTPDSKLAPSAIEQANKSRGWMPKGTKE